MQPNEIAKYAIYTIGFFAICYTTLFIIRYILMFYIIMMMKKIAKKLPKFTEKKQTNQSFKIHEDEKYRDQKNEIFKQQAAEIQKHLQEEKEIEGDDTINVEVKKIGANIFQERDAFSQGTPRLEANIIDEIIVGIMPLGKFAKGILGKRERDMLQNIMQEMKQQGEATKWRDYIAARKQQLQQERTRNL